MRPLPSSLLLAILRRLPAPGLGGIFSLPRVLFDLLLAPVLFTVSLLASLLIPVTANAQLSGAAGVDYNYQRSMSRIIAGSASGLQVSSNSTLDIINGGRRVGSIALKEKRLIDLATMAGRAVSIPGMIAIGATVLLQYGLEKCADGTWCKPGQGEQAPNGKPFPIAGGYYVSGYTTGFYPTPEAACQADVGYWNGQQPTRGWSYVSWRVANGDLSTFTQFYCAIKDNTGYVWDGPLGQHPRGCPAGYAQTATECIPPGYTPGTQPMPATSDEISQAWQRAMQANPAYQQQYWGFEDPAAQNAAWANAMAQLAEVIGTGTVQDVGPTTSTTDSAGKVTKKQTTCTYTGTANPDMATAKDKPIQVGQKCVTTTTNPDGTTSTETTETGTAPATGTTPPKVEVETCGLPGKPACKIDETGTKEQSDVDTHLQNRSAEMDAKLGVVQQAANETLANVEQKHDQVHIFALFNYFPTFASEVCDNPTIPGVSGGSLPIDICTYYYMLKDVMAFGVALFVLVDSVQVVREAVKV
ncbi:hypothetical protein [Cupriavidus campinensis]|uniref:hypothetical protein n=1 Tax=Cupriavidus campinensis TaxID=151783 RepID=UPI0024E26F8A|nr:hypothetical protein [Cupriavidus campinensis]